MQTFLIRIGLLATLLTANTIAQRSADGPAYHYNTIVNNWLKGSTLDVPVKCGLPALSHSISHEAELDGPALLSLEAVRQRPLTQKKILAGDFKIHFDTTGMHEPALLNASYERIPGTATLFVDSVISVLSKIVRVEHEILGFELPPSDGGEGGGPEYDIYIRELGGSLYGVTTPETPINNKPDGATFTSFIVIDNDFDFVFPDTNKGLPALRVTLAHEFHHAIQLERYGFWSREIYFYEITSTWMEDVVYSEVNEYYQYLRAAQGHFRLPHVPFTSNGFIMYSRGIWGSFVAKRFGPETMLRAWELIRTLRPIEAMDNSLQERGSGLRQAFGEWSVWNYYTGNRSDPVKYYPEGSFYPLMIEIGKGFSPPSRMFPDSLLALSTRYYDVVGGQVPLKLITSNINLPAVLNSNDSYFGFKYLMNTTRVDDSYVATASGIYVKFDAPDRLNWVNVVDTSSVTIIVPPSKNSPFPSPFFANGVNVVKIPISNFGSTQGTLSIFSSSMDLKYAVSKSSIYTTALGQQVFEWDGRDDDGRIAPSGVYIYILDLPGKTVAGKIALVRR